MKQNPEKKKTLAPVMCCISVCVEVERENVVVRLYSLCYSIVY